ncbi:MAG: hypothetical protein H6610_11820 [Ignavibacteriales bacterium]|nr:hypothetical protein [Ignavibacteriales bacterium]
MSWEVIDKHRSEARKTKFDILIWGPSTTDDQLFSVRDKIKTYLNSLGHSAKFSEDLINEGMNKAAPDPIIDEFFHADAAHIIIVLYRSRGTQTEFDRILKYEKFARKTLIFVEEYLWEKLQSSLSKSSWTNSVCSMKIISQFDGDLLINFISEYLDKLQFSEYLIKLELSLLSKRN